MSLKWYQVEPIESISLRVNDILLSVSDIKVNKDVVFVAIDEPSVNRFGRWPWDRSVIAKGLRHLSQADSVMVDMIFSEPTTPKEDENLSDALASIASVCGFFLRHNATQNVSVDQEELLFDSTLERLQHDVNLYGSPQFGRGEYAEVNTVTLLQGCSISGTFTTERDKDSLFRRYPVAYYFNDLLFPSLGVQALRLKFDSDLLRKDEKTLLLHDTALHVDTHGFVNLNYYELDQYKQISFEKLYDGRYDDNYFQGKVVIIGITEVGASDVRSTPKGAMTGGLLHYTFISNFLNDELVVRSFILDFISAFCLMFSVVLIVIGVKSLLVRMISYGVVALLFWVVVIAVFKQYFVAIDLFYPIFSFVVMVLIVEVQHYFEKEREQAFIQSAFINYLSAPLLKKLMDSPETLQLGGEKKMLSILFSDIRSFTSISENMEPGELSQMLNRYFNPMSDAVKAHGGIVDKYIGDAVMAFFNAPVNVENHADAACECALAMIAALETLNRAFVLENLPELRIGIGINTAEVAVGNFGADDRFNYTVIGDGVNLASRVEGLNKQFGSNIIITEYTKAQIDSKFLLRRLEYVKVKGKEHAVLLYELLADTVENRDLCVRYNEAIEQFERDNVVEAEKILSNLSDQYDDKVSAYFAKRYREALRK